MSRRPQPFLFKPDSRLDTARLGKIKWSKWSSVPWTEADRAQVIALAFRALGWASRLKNWASDGVAPKMNGIPLNRWESVVGCYPSLLLLLLLFLINH